MRIAQLCPLWETVPPPAYGGIESVVTHLTEELVRRGHEVTLFAAGNSRTTAELRAVVACNLRAMPDLHFPHFYEWVHVAAALRCAEEFDVIHNHHGELAMAFSAFCPTPMLTTNHGPLIPDAGLVWDQYQGYYNTISHAAKVGLPDRNYLGVVYNGIDIESFPFRTEKEDFLLFLSRISPEKGPHHAIEVARALGRQLLIAGKVDRVDREYFAKEIEPRIDGRQIVFLGEADARLKRDLFARATCLLHPITWPEPFGLVMVEAMACGTPVIVFRRGSAPEIVIDSETGFVVDSLDQMIAAVDQLHHISPHRCREHVASRFSVSQMVDGYEALYRRICAGEPPR